MTASTLAQCRLAQCWNDGGVLRHSAECIMKAAHGSRGWVRDTDVTCSIVHRSPLCSIQRLCGHHLGTTWHSPWGTSLHAWSCVTLSVSLPCALGAQHVRLVSAWPCVSVYVRECVCERGLRPPAPEPVHVESLLCDAWGRCAPCCMGSFVTTRNIDTGVWFVCMWWKSRCAAAACCTACTHSCVLLPCTHRALLWPHQLLFVPSGRHHSRRL